MTEAMLASLEQHPTVDPRRYLGAARDALTTEAARLMALLSSAR